MFISLLLSSFHPISVQCFSDIIFWFKPLNDCFRGAEIANFSKTFLLLMMCGPFNVHFTLIVIFCHAITICLSILYTLLLSIIVLVTRVPNNCCSTFNEIVFLLILLITPGENVNLIGVVL